MTLRDREGTDGLSGLPPERRAFLTRLAMDASVVVPVVTSFRLVDTPPPALGLRHLWR